MTTYPAREYHGHRNYHDRSRRHEDRGRRRDPRPEDLDPRPTRDLPINEHYRDGAPFNTQQQTNALRGIDISGLRQLIIDGASTIWGPNCPRDEINVFVHSSRHAIGLLAATVVRQARGKRFESKEAKFHRQTLYFTGKDAPDVPQALNNLLAATFEATKNYRATQLVDILDLGSGYEEESEED